MLTSLLRDREAAEKELLDLPGHDPAALAENLEDLRRVNRWLGGSRLTVRALERLLPDLVPGRSCRFLDVGTGGADIATALVAWGRKRGVHLDVCATDVSGEILRLARRTTGREVRLLVADGRGLPFVDQSFDVAGCSLLLHHLAPRDAIDVLTEMARVARWGTVVNDLVRGVPSLLGAWLFSRLFSRNPLTRNDAPLSARRAYTMEELRGLISSAGLAPGKPQWFVFSRVAFAARRPA